MKRSEELYNDFFDLQHQDTSVRRTAMYSKDGMIAFAKFVRENTLQDDLLNNSPEAWNYQFTKVFSYVGLILFVFGVLFLIIKSYS